MTLLIIYDIIVTNKAGVFYMQKIKREINNSILKNKQSNLRIFAFKNLVNNLTVNGETAKLKKSKVREVKKIIKKKFGNMFVNVEKSQKFVEKKKARKRKLTNIFSFVFNIIVLAIVLVGSFWGQDDKTSVLFPAIEWKYIAVIVGIFAVIMILDSLKFLILIRQSTKKIRPHLAYKVSALGRYYDAVTPMSTGGQPFQMMYLNKHGIKGDVATSIPLVRYMFWQITYVLICSGILLYNQFCNQAATQIFSTVVAWIGVMVNVLILLTVAILSISKKVGPLVVIWVLKLGSKMKLIKNYRVTFRKVMRFVINYQKTMRMFAKNFWVLISELLLAAVDTVLYNIIPFFIYKAFVPAGTLGIIDIMIQSIICNLTVGFIPTPGASGGAEAFFASIFGPMFEGKTFWPLLIWRISTYYINLLQGLLVLIYDFLIGNKRLERQRLREMGIQPTEPTFKDALIENRESIAIVQDQEEDKLLLPTLLSNEFPKEPKSSAEDIIKDSELVTAEEMKKGVMPAEQMLNKVRMVDIKKRKAKKLKKQVKIERKTKKRQSKQQSNKSEE